VFIDVDTGAFIVVEDACDVVDVTNEATEQITSVTFSGYGTDI
jgi:hypothetical protein